jgi:hypothetical protein
VRRGYLEGLQKLSVAKTRGAIFHKAQLLFSVIVGQVWFSEFPTLDDKTLTLLIGGQEIVGTASLEEIEIQI